MEYQLYLSEEKYRTNMVAGSNRNPIYSYARQHTQEWVTDGFIKYLKEDCLIFRVYGFAEIKKRAGADKPLASQSVIKSKVNTSNLSGEQSTIDLSADISK